NHVGDGKVPFTPIPAADQKAAMKFLREKVWDADVFHFSPELINKLQPERFPDFKWSVYKMQRIDYPLHAQILAVQARPLYYIYHPITLARLGDIALHYGLNEDVYTMTEIFQDTRRAIWTPEITAPRNSNGFRRNLQRAHLDIIIRLVTDKKLKVPEDARTLARVDLKVLKGAINKALGGSLNTISRGHLEESLARINAALTADLDYKL
ncbi:MAG: zinc-dependent metalloprotease, partial [candidate division Zixibacteria bacterium]|nr:zinc-dependent metalloprotease [candidate division Zixibacteria bacterium]